MNISQITSSINSFFSTINAKITKVVPMPAILLLCAAMSRQGLSPLRSLSNVCKALEELGIPMGANPDGSPNLIISILNEVFKEAYRAFTEDAVIQGGIEPGAMQVMSNGANGGGPMVSIGTNILPTHIWGVIQ